MKIALDGNNYLKIEEKDKAYASLTIKARRDKGSIVLVTADLDIDMLDKLISELVSLRSRIRHV